MDTLETIRNKMGKKVPLIGSHVKWTDSSVAEIMAMSGVDYVWIDGEHSGMSIETINNHIRAIQSRGTAAFYRVPWNDPVLAKPYLEMGLDGIIFPFVSTKEEAEKAIAACLYPPKGSRGFGPARADEYGFMSKEDYLRKADNLIKIIMIEHVDAIDRLEGN